MTSNRSTATTGAPRTSTIPILMPMDKITSAGWKRTPVVTSISRSVWCTLCRRHKTGTAWNSTCWPYMARSRAIIPSTTAGQPDRPTTLNSPHPWGATNDATDMAVAGITRRRITESSATMPRLFIHRVDLEAARGLRGDRPSQSAITTRMAKKGISLRGSS